MNPIEVSNTKSLIKVKDACIDDSTFESVSLANVTFIDVNLTGIKIANANMTGIEIKDAQLGGAYIHGIGLPPEDHPDFTPGATQQPITFEDCYLGGSTLTNCNLTNVVIKDCDLKGMTINGIAVESLLNSYKKGH
ncbi:pentapeptide repeat-containing protein [Emticicia sp. TH156]|uniref:pentapeptide repeat-containing protein n=1 Tax=Emticicia sp. TH156 TaxID=2067454 RepID=UPI000C794571|nr:pentapeptide repeat-containing protein [Emticicia sp. TH156]PLK45670.1 pentapeptide repeat-containing protein [Emticicia sp. TH156]